MGNNTDNSIIGDLFSANETIVLETLKEISFNGKTHYIPVMIELLHSTNSSEVKNSIIKILSELKLTNAVPVLIDAIKDPKFKNEQEILVRICWENGLNFSPYLSTFVDLAIHGDYMTSFEAITVIENSDGKISEEEVQLLTSTIERSMDKIGAERKVLLTNIINFLPTLIA